MKFTRMAVTHLACLLLLNLKQTLLF